MAITLSFNPDNLPQALYEYEACGRVCFSPKHPRDLWRILLQVDTGFKTIRYAAEELNWTMDDVQEVLWGEIRL
jgi:hypothetical protein